MWVRSSGEDTGGQGVQGDTAVALAAAEKGAGNVFAGGHLPGE